MDDDLASDNPVQDNSDHGEPEHADLAFGTREPDNLVVVGNIRLDLGDGHGGAVGNHRLAVVVGSHRVADTGCRASVSV